MLIKPFSEKILHKYSAAVVIKNNRILGLWFPDDFIFCNGQSAQEKDRVDAQRMHDYLKQIGFYQKVKRLRSSDYLN
ncbi:hypothetical protein LCGC14_0507600 [marine sediment metagenome]|uniref:Uncharacterized protein n=1 Tax=marine sediment metagenome TaxID=412755 RepID=A0A0F9UNT9_9ZZZZ